MKVITLLESVSRADGGIFEAECALQRQLSLSQGVKIDVVGMEDPFTAQDAARWLPLKPKALRIKGPGALGYSPDLLAALDPKADLLYAATLWKYPSWAALKWAERTGKPMMVAPHGSIDPWALANAAWKKRIAAALFKDRQLHKAACLRALCQSEADAFRAYGLRNPIAIIPNGVDLPDFTESRVEGRGTRAEGEDGGRKTLLFLGRIHPKKGLPNLIRAFAQSRKSRVAVTDAKQRPGLQSREPWRLMIAGWDQGGHEAELIQLCGELELRVEGRGSRDESQRNKAEVEGGNIQWNTALDTDVIFTGPAFKEEKDALLRSADAFVLPSFSEGLPMSVLEAWAYGLPIVMTPECNLPEGYAAEAAIRIETDAPSIAAGLNALFSMKDVDLRAMGGRGYELVKQRFTWRTVAAQMRSVYDWMLGGGTPPECVRMD